MPRQTWPWSPTPATPGINDPGQELVSAAQELGFDVVPVPGPSAVTTAIAVSGLPVDQFIYLGFPPRKPSGRRLLLQSLSAEPRALVVLEAPHRLKAFLDDAVAALGDRRVAVCRELTKLHEEIYTGTLSEALAYFEQPRGEFTIVIEGAGDSPEPAGWDEARSLASELRLEEIGAREAVPQIMAAGGLSRREAYAVWLEAGASPMP